MEKSGCDLRAWLFEITTSFWVPQSVVNRLKSPNVLQSNSSPCTRSNIKLFGLSGVEGSHGIPYVSRFSAALPRVFPFFGYTIIYSNVIYDDYM